MNKIQRITRVPVRELWPTEDRDFTVWLADNIDILKETLHLELHNVEREKSTGNFYVDLLAEDASGNLVVIENQFENSDHNHLGKLITYFTSFDARAAIWIVEFPRQEHIKAVSWLNEATEYDFYLVKLEGIKIGESAPAPLFTQIVGPSLEAKQAGKVKKNRTENHKERLSFWKALIEQAKATGSPFGTKSPTEHVFIGTSTGLSGVRYVIWLNQTTMRVEVGIDTGIGETNSKIFEALFSKKAEIEKAFGGALIWDEKPNSRACGIHHVVESGGYKSPGDKWLDIHTEALNVADSLKKATKGIIGKIKI